MVTKIEQESAGIPVLGHSEGVCHVYVDIDCDPQMALNVGKSLTLLYSLCESLELAECLSVLPQDV